MNVKKQIAIILAGLAPQICLAQINQTINTNPNTGITTWETHADGVSFSLTQIYTDQVRAFYVNRGFTLEQTEPYATACVLMVVLRNDNAPGVVHFTLQDWSIIAKGKTRPPMDVERWIKLLEKSGVNKPALIAFRWAQFPPEQEYAPGGDWNQGMMAMGMGLSVGYKVDVIARWDVNNQSYEGILKNVHCAD